MVARLEDHCELKIGKVYALVVGRSADLELALYDGIEKNQSLLPFNRRLLHRCHEFFPDGVIIYRIREDGFKLILHPMLSYRDNMGRSLEIEGIIVPYPLPGGKLFHTDTYVPFNDNTFQGVSVEAGLALAGPD